MYDFKPQALYTDVLYDVKLQSHILNFYISYIILQALTRTLHVWLNPKPTTPLK